MALLKGKGSMTGVNLVGRVFDKGQTKDGKTRFIDFQVDARDKKAGPQTNAHLVAEKRVDKDGVERINNASGYSTEQFEAIVAAAGPNKERITDKDGNEVGTIYGVKANLMPASRGNGLVINHKSVEQSDFKVGNDTLDNQYASMKEAKAAQGAKNAKQAAAPEQAAEVEQAVEVEEPAVG